MNRIIFLSLILFSFRSWSFPENVRHGYFSCTACHVSPSGGGVLTPYGRSLSAELMSTWGTPKTAGFLFSDNESEKNPPWFRATALLRGVQTYRNNPKVEAAKYIPMQADLEAGADFEKFAVILTGGFRSNGRTQDLNEFFSRRHYLLYRFNDSISARIGKYTFAFGLNMPDHITATRRGLGWDQGTESYNLEINYQLERILTQVTAVTNSPEERGATKDRGYAVKTDFLIKDHSKVGFSAYTGERDTYRRLVYGPQWVFSLTDRVFLMSEFFWQKKELKTAPSSTQNGYATFHRLGYEAAKGVIPFAQLDRSYLDTSDNSQRFDTYGLGVQWLPYPHFELLSYLGKEKTADQSPTDFAWLMMNLYL